MEKKQIKNEILLLSSPEKFLNHDSIAAQYFPAIINSLNFKGFVMSLVFGTFCGILSFFLLQHFHIDSGMIAVGLGIACGAFHAVTELAHEDHHHFFLH